MPALEEVDCEFIGPGGARVERTLGDVVRCPVAVRDACATSVAHPRDASRQQSDSAKPSLARALRDAALSNGALTEITRALSPSTRDGAAPKAALAWHPTKEILATTDDGGRCATRDAAMDDTGALRARKRASDDESECEDEGDDAAASRARTVRGDGVAAETGTSARARGRFGRVRLDARATRDARVERGGERNGSAEPGRRGESAGVGAARDEREDERGVPVEAYDLQRARSARGGADGAAGRDMRVGVRGVEPRWAVTRGVLAKVSRDALLGRERGDVHAVGRAAARASPESPSARAEVTFSPRTWARALACGSATR